MEDQTNERLPTQTAAPRVTELKVSKLSLVLIGVVGFIAFIVMMVSQPGPQTPLVDYDWSTFVENKRLSQDFTESVREALDPQHTEKNPHWLRMKREMFSEIGYLGFRELRIDLLRGFKSNRYVGFTVIKRDGSESKSWSTASEHYHFPMVVIFQDDGSLVVKTNGAEKKFGYNKAGLQQRFTWLLFIVINKHFEKTQRFQELELQRQHDAEREAVQQREKNRRSWE